MKNFTMLSHRVWNWDHLSGNLASSPVIYVRLSYKTSKK